MNRLFAALFTFFATIFAIPGFAPNVDPWVGFCAAMAVWCALGWLRPPSKDADNAG